jgi:hypothetical protein
MARHNVRNKIYCNHSTDIQNPLILPVDEPGMYDVTVFEIGREMELFNLSMKCYKQYFAIPVTFGK